MSSSRSSDPPNSLGAICKISPLVSNEDLNALFDAAWPIHEQRDFAPILNQSLAYVCAYSGDGENLIGFVNLAWDGGLHAFVLDTTVHPDFQRQGIGRQLVELAATTAKGRGVQWLHVDFEPHLATFYEQCGFRSTMAGLRLL